MRQQFTLKERDVETGLDYFGARYYGSMQGRFVSPDPLLSSGKLEDPQTWNHYSYTLNNPLALIDPTGLFTIGAGVSHDEQEHTEGKLLPGKSVNFTVPQEDFPKCSQLFVDFDFSWELSRGERLRDEVVHRTYFLSIDLPRWPEK